MSSNFIDNLKGLIDFSGTNPHLIATPSDIAKVTTPQYSMATPNEITALTSSTPDTISLEQAVNELPRVSKSGNIAGGKPGQKLAANKSANKIVETTKNLNTLFDNAVGVTTKGADKTKIMNLLKTAARPTSRVGVRALGPVGAILGAGATIKDAYDLGKAIVDNYNVNRDFNEKAYQEAQLRQMRRAEGKSTPEIDTELEELKARKAASDAEVLRQQALTDKAKANYDAVLAAQQQAVSDVENVSPTQNITPSNTEDISLEGNIPITPTTNTTLDYTDLNNIGNYSLNAGTPTGMTAVAAKQQIDPLAAKFTQDILGVDNALNREQILQQLNNNMERVRATLALDPRYQGGLLTPENPYNANIKDIQRANRFAEYYTAFTNPSQLADVTAQNAEHLYQQQLANQAGVPYADYITATTEARANELTNLATERDNILKQQATQATNMKEKIGYMQERYKLQQEYQKAMLENRLKGEYDLQKQLLTNRGNLDVAQTGVAGDITLQNMKAQDPARLLGGYASLGEALAFTPEMYRGQYLYNLPQSIKVQMGIQSLTPEELQALFSGRTNQVMQQQTRPTMTDRFNAWLNSNKEQ